MKDYYQILGISKNATQAEIKKSFRKLAGQYHPDKNSTSGSTEKFKEINEAYGILSDENKRKQYDTFGTSDFSSGQSGSTGPAGGFGGFDFSGFSGAQGDIDLDDILSQFFGGGAGQRRSTRDRYNSGSDLRYSLTISFEESVYGGEKEISFYTNGACNLCSGSGSKDGKIETCSTCKGVGQVRRMTQSLFGNMSVVSDCPDCHGEGKKIKSPCPLCKGAGRTRQERRIKIKIIKGTRDGMEVRFKGQGEAGEKGSATGDLYVQFHVTPSRLYERKGDDVYITQHIKITTAVLGDKIFVSTLWGDEQLKIPAGTVSGEIFKLKGKGIDKINAGGKGDQYIEITIDIPKKLSREERSLWEKLADLS